MHKIILNYENRCVEWFLGTNDCILKVNLSLSQT